MRQKMEMKAFMAHVTKLLQLPEQALWEHIEFILDENDFVSVDEIHEGTAEIASEYSDGDFYVESRPSTNRVAACLKYHNDMISNVESKPTTLHEHLCGQLAFCDMSTRLQDFSKFLIYNLDPNGTLQIPLSEIVFDYEGEIRMDEAEHALVEIQKMDPPGVGASDGKERLLLQLSDDMVHRNILDTLIRYHFEDLTDERLPLAAQKTGYSIELIQQAMSELRYHVNPFPGRQFEERTERRINPDVEAFQNDDGQWTVKLLRPAPEFMKIHTKYEEILGNSASKQTKDHIRKEVGKVKWTIDCIQMGRETLRCVAQAIVYHQSSFLESGPNYIRPLRMQEVADQIGVNLSTVSRTVSDRWIETPQGLFPLRRFFVRSTKTYSGKIIARELALNAIQDLVDNEDKSNPLSDDQLDAQLAQLGFSLSRRTVTKYRTMADIPPSSRRRRY
ncbi:RNA polymerase factor sigma-54 [Gimesia maris]|uniref:RNA polymerase factor sigma-54 n=1 Tax=Gimesia maris TaxID=122 RepID=UPI001E2D5FA2|nr:RNA polymerase factor sigma-54 [Gimesia maris]